MQRKFTLKQVRALNDLTQKEMAESIGMKPANYASYERYEKVFKMDKAYEFAQIAGIDIDNIIFFKEQLQN